METLIIEKDKAIIAYQNADQPGKQLLKDLFGSKVLADRMEAVKTFEDACEVLGIDPRSSLPSVDHLSQDGRSILAYASGKPMWALWAKGEDFGLMRKIFSFRFDRVSDLLAALYNFHRVTTKK